MTTQMHFRDLDPHALLVQECDYPYCGHLTLHGFVSRIGWRWAPDKKGTAVMPNVVCAGCGQQWRVEFAVEPKPTAAEASFKAMSEFRALVLDAIKNGA